MTDNTLQANRILLFIEQPTLNNTEKGLLTTADGLEPVLKSLASILNLRTDSEGAIKKLNAYAVTQNINLEAKKTFKSNVFVGAPL